MGPWTTPLLIASALLAVAGAPKILNPTNTVGAMRSIGVRVPPMTVRLFGAVETALGIATFVTGARALAALVALSYAGFSAFLVVALRKGGAVSSCGCVGRADTPPTRSHLAVTAGLALTSLLAAVSGADGLSTIDWTVTTLTALVFAVLGGWLVWLVFTALPHLMPKES
jgi:hypothetical protein